MRLDTANALIFFNLEFSYLSYEQGKNRLVSKERTSPADVYFLCSDCGIESKILEAVHGKDDMAELESKIQSRIIKRLEAEGYYVVKLILTNKPGIPDLLCLKNGKVLFIEVKRPEEKPRPLQEYRMNELRNLGFECEVRRE